MQTTLIFMNHACNSNCNAILVTRHSPYRLSGVVSTVSKLTVETTSSNLHGSLLTRYISVALSLESPPPDVIRHPALRSPDFPHLRPFGACSCDRLSYLYISFLLYHDSIVSSMRFSPSAAVVASVSHRSFCGWPS